MPAHVGFISWIFSVTLLVSYGSSRNFKSNMSPIGRLCFSLCSLLCQRFCLFWREFHIDTESRVFAPSLVLPRAFNQSFVDTELVPIIVSDLCKMNSSYSVSFRVGHIHSQVHSQQSDCCWAKVKYFCDCQSSTVTFSSIDVILPCIIFNSGVSLQFRQQGV